MERNNVIVLTGLIGLLAAVLVGAGEFLLHFDPLARYSEVHYDFMLATSDLQQTIGHFLGALGAPLYIVGCWHIYLMLKPANQKLAFFGFLIGAYGFMLGADWISSRASIGALIHAKTQGMDVDHLINLYQIRYESLLTVVRITTLLSSVIFIYLAATGRSHYQKWHAFFSPIVLLLLSFVVYLINPSIGKYLMPIALNVGFGLFFILSLIQTKKLRVSA
ncbi:DUF6796 family protein [Paraglaciecola sp. L1A13]|uniref:DUF6796 family protein n=1 Tax=Paraglaciecola sp. L1A13 TaxID=2686359 RepID=UPI00131B5D8C|nr:DUF6796 family protein [Paraglaciecola sp. L1A13]